MRRIPIIPTLLLCFFAISCAAKDPIAPPKDNTTTKDTTPPKIISTSPKAGETDVPVDVAPVVNFSEKMEPASISVNDVRLLGDGGAEFPITLALDTNGRQLTITPDRPLPAGAKFSVEIGAITDLAGNPLEGNPVVFDFVTKP